jgi:heptosyltransferase I
MAQKVLLLRLDKIGDLICTLCVDQVSFLKDKEVHWAIAQGLGFVPSCAEPPRAFIEFKKDRSSLKQLRAFLEEWKPDVAVCFQAPWWVHFALWVEDVPVRAGVLSQWHSFLFLNKGLRQKRSQAQMHESEYNLELLKHAFDIKDQVPCPVLKLKAPRNPQLFEKYNLQKDSYLVVHPGMAGSALNWSISSYIQLIQQAITKFQVVLTGTPADEAWLSKIKERFKSEPSIVILQNKLSAEELLTILENSFAVIVPSTGVAHLAASLKARVMGIYSPLRVQHPRRWAARGEHVKIYVPVSDTLDEASKEIMNNITPEKLWADVLDLPQQWR